MELSKNLYRN